MGVSNGVCNFSRIGSYSRNSRKLADRELKPVLQIFATSLSFYLKLPIMC